MSVTFAANEGNKFSIKTCMWNFYDWTA